MSNYDWSCFRLRIPIKAAAQTIYNAWATQDGIESWFLRSADFVKHNGTLRYRDELVEAGDTYTWLWYGYADDTVEIGDILAANGHNHLHFTFNNTATNKMTVTVDILQEHGETVVELVQQDIPLDEHSKASYHIGCMQGWTFYLANLKSVLEGGLDLRNRNVAIKRVVSS